MKMDHLGKAVTEILRVFDSMKDKYLPVVPGT